VGRLLGGVGSAVQRRTAQLPIWSRISSAPRRLSQEREEGDKEEKRSGFGAQAPPGTGVEAERERAASEPWPKAAKEARMKSSSCGP
jgi:hypothetical protein